MPAWFRKAATATACVAPTYLAIPLFNDRFGIDPLVFMIWYFLGVAAGVAAYAATGAIAGRLLPSPKLVAAMLLVGGLFGALAYGSLFEAIGMAPNPGLPPVIYATASLIVFALSPLLARILPDLFRPVSAEPGRLAGIALVLGGLYLLAGGRIGLG